MLFVCAGCVCAGADTVLLFGFDTTDNGTSEYDGIYSGGSKQSMIFSGAVNASGETVFDALDEQTGTVNFLLGAVGDFSSLSGTMAASGGSFNIGGYGGGVFGGSNNNYIDSESESWTFTFSRDVTLTAVNFYGPDTGGQSIWVDGAAVPASPLDDDAAGLEIFVEAGDALTFGYAGSGNGYAISDFTVQVVPEPMAALLIGIGGLLMLVVRRFSGT